MLKNSLFFFVFVVVLFQRENEPRQTPPGQLIYLRRLHTIGEPILIWSRVKRRHSWTKWWLLFFFRRNWGAFSRYSAPNINVLLKFRKIKTRTMYVLYKYSFHLVKQQREITFISILLVTTNMFLGFHLGCYYWS